MMKKEEKTIAVVAILALFLAFGLYSGWFDMGPETIKILDKQTCIDVMSKINRDGTYAGPQLYEISACCFKDGEIVSCDDYSSDFLAMTVGGGTTPYDAVIVLADVVNTGTVELEAQITDVTVAAGDGSSANMAGIADNSFTNVAINFPESNYAYCSGEGCGGHTDQTTCAAATGCVWSTGSTTPILQSAIYDNNQILTLEPGWQGIWATVIWLNGNTPNENLPLNPGTADITTQVTATDPTGQLSPVTETITRELTLGQAALDFSLRMYYGLPT